MLGDLAAPLDGVTLLPDGTVGKRLVVRSPTDELGLVVDTGEVGNGAAEVGGAVVGATVVVVVAVVVGAVVVLVVELVVVVGGLVEIGRAHV